MSTPASVPFRSARLVDTPPDLTRPDAGLVAVTELEVGGPDRLQALLKASAAAWKTLPWPETLLSIAWLAGTRDDRALAWAQWKDDSGFDAFGRTHRPVLAAAFRDAVPGLVAGAPTFYRRYRSGTRPDAPPAGCIVVVSVEFDGPDESRQRAWVDLVFEALAAEASPPPGGLGAHFHLSIDGTRVLNYAEWTDEAAHRDALARSGQNAVGSGAAWRAVQTFPGLKSSRVERYRFARRLVGDALTA